MPSQPLLPSPVASQSSIDQISSSSHSTTVQENLSTSQHHNASPVASSDLPGTFCRIEDSNTVHVVFPIHEYLRCPESNCETIIIQHKWSESQNALLRHLTNVHMLPRPSVTRWCGVCKIIIPPKISSHSCFKSGGFFAIKETASDFPHQFLNSVLPFFPVWRWIGQSSEMAFLY